MPFFRRILIFLIIFFLSTQIIIPILVPENVIYNGRINYDVFKNNPYYMDVTVREIKKIIDREKPYEIYILMGDSVGYSTPGGPETAINTYMENLANKENRNIRVFNLSAPSMMIGDIYLTLQLLNQNNIPTDHVFINMSYWELQITQPVFWLKSHMRLSRPDWYSQWVDTKGWSKTTPVNWIKETLNAFFTRNVSIFAYREFFTNNLKKKGNRQLGVVNTTILSPWFKKPELAISMKKPENAWYYTDKPFVFDNTNPQLFFMNEIMKMQQEKQTLFFMASLNKDMLGAELDKVGFKNNLTGMKAYMAANNIPYIDFNGSIAGDLFSDHVHLLPKGYEQVAKTLWETMKTNDVISMNEVVINNNDAKGEK